MDKFVERWNSNEKVINRIIKCLLVGKDDDIEEPVNQIKGNYIFVFFLPGIFYIFCDVYS